MFQPQAKRNLISSIKPLYTTQRLQNDLRLYENFITGWRQSPAPSPPFRNKTSAIAVNNCAKAGIRHLGKHRVVHPLIISPTKQCPHSQRGTGYFPSTFRPLSYFHQCPLSSHYPGPPQNTLEFINCNPTY